MEVEKWHIEEEGVVEVIGVVVCVVVGEECFWDVIAGVPAIGCDLKNKSLVEV